MAASSTHRGWLTKHNEGILAAVYNGAMPGTTLLASNTALDGVLLGTPVSPALAVDSLVISNLVASGDFLLATNSAGNSQAWIWVDTSAGLMTLYRQGVSALEFGANVVFNEGSADRDFRVETNGIEYAIYADGGKDALVLGSNTDTSSADQLITVSRAARTATANIAYYDFIVAPAGAVTVPAGTTAVVASMRLNEPNITATGTVTRAATLVIGSQPTEGGTANAAIYFAAAANIAATTSLTFNEDSEDIDFRFESNGMAYAIYSDGGKDALVLGSNTDTSSADQLITISRAARTATANINYFDLALAPAGAVTVPAGTTAVVATVSIAEPNITSTGTTTRAATLYLASQPTEGGTANATILFGAAANIACTTSLTFNEDSEDIDFRFESNGMAYAIYSDGGKDALVLGSNTDTSSVDQLITVSRAARSNTSATSYYDLRVAPAGAVTTTGVTAVVATVSLVEPNITVSSDSVTNATTLHIASQPTEGGTTNSAIYFGAAANIACTTSLTFNEDSADIDFRFESNGMAYAIYSDGGKDALVLGSNTDTSSVDQLITVSRAARTATANIAYYDLAIQPAGAVTIPAGTTAVVASLMIAEPNITATGTVTNACTVYISGVPTEGGTGNYGLFIDAGGARIDGDLTVNDAAMDIIMKAATAAALEISDGTTKFYAIDTRVATASVTTHTFNISAYTIASGATNVETGWSFAAHTLNYTGTTQVTSEVVSASIGARTIAGDTATLTVDKATSLRVVAPIEGTNVTLTGASAIRIGDSGAGTPTNQYGIFIEALTAGATKDYAIWVAGANAVHLGTAGTATGLLEIDGVTSGTVTITVAAAAGTWTMTLPPDDGTNGDQLTVAAGDGVCTWAAAASSRELKDILGEHDAQDALDKILNTKVYDFHYKPGKGTQDSKTDYVGVVADEAPWAMHYNESKVNPINSLGYTLLGFQAMAAKIRALESKLAAMGCA